MQVELDHATGLAVRVSTVAGQTTRHHKHPDRQSEGCNGWADGNASVASFNYVHGTAFMPIPIDGTPDRGGGGAQGGSKHIYVCDEDNSRIRRVELSTRATITLADVLFGDVWVCSGQSNMAYSLNGSNGNSIVHPPVNNSAAEFADMANYPHIRMIRAGKQKPSSPLLEPHPNDPGGSMPAVQGWTPPCTDGICRVDFSSMCYFFGRDIYDSLAKHDTPRPVGLIGTYWGGTADELWSSPEALKVRPTQLLKPN